MSRPLKKKRLIQGLLSWTASAHARIDSSHSLRTKCEGMDYEQVLSSMTTQQLQLMMSLVAGTYTRGCGETREHIRQLRTLRESDEYQKRAEAEILVEAKKLMKRVNAKEPGDFVSYVGLERAIKRLEGKGA